MNRHVFVISLGISLCFTPIGCSPSKDLPHDETTEVWQEGPDRFLVSIWPEKTCVRMGESFNVNVTLRIQNATTKPLSFRFMRDTHHDGISYHWSLKINNNRINGGVMGPPGGSSGFSLGTVQLQPGEAIEQHVQLAVDDNLSVKDIHPPALVSIQVGFTPLEEKKTYWSNKVLLGVKLGNDK